MKFIHDEVEGFINLNAVKLIKKEDSGFWRINFFYENDATLTLSFIFENTCDEAYWKIFDFIQSDEKLLEL